MTAQPQLTPQVSIQEHRYVYPTVRPLAMTTAHPSAEVWAPRLRAVRPLASRGAIRPRTYVVVPSRTVEKSNEPPAVTHAYEERLLCSLLELRDPAVRITYVTSVSVAPAIVDYYLALLPRGIRRDARSRLTLVALGDPGRRPLSRKLLDRPALLERIAGSIRHGTEAALVPYTTTGAESEVSEALGIAMYGAAPCHGHFGTKSGCRKLFAAAGVPHPAGVEGISSVASLVEAIARLRAANPGLTRVVVKLDEGVAGEGNATVHLGGLPAPGAPDETSLIDRRVGQLVPELGDMTPANYLVKLAQRGGIVEEWIEGRELRSPSVQLQVTPSGDLQVLSSHDQILGGPTGQSYRGCRFPADPAYSAQISAHARRIGARLAASGVVGRFAIDFVVTRRSDGAWYAWAIELNLRKGGTTHPYETLVGLTGGTYDADSGVFSTRAGHQKHYVATDHLEPPALEALGRDGVLALARRPDLRFDPLRGTGAVFHMLSSIDGAGRAGVTAISDTAAGADRLFAHVEDVLLSAP